MEEKIQRELELYGFTKDMLTAEELKKLEEEILLKEQGYFILDGILESIPVYSRERNLRMKKLHNLQRFDVGRALMRNEGRM
jgi:hypothetical protein